MLWDPKWQEKVTPAVRPLQAWQKKYLAAADYLERCGWRQGALGMLGEQMCVIGALKAVNASDAEALPLVRYLFGGGRVDHGLGFLPGWNDDPGRTKEQVIFALRDCAKSGE